MPDLDREELQAINAALEHLNTYETPPETPTPGMRAQAKVRRELGLDPEVDPEPTPSRSFAVYTYATDVTPPCHIYAYDENGTPLDQAQAQALGVSLQSPSVGVMVLPAEDHVIPA